MELLEEVAFKIISAAGDSFSSMVKGLKCAKEGDFAKADDCMIEAEKQLAKAHKIQTDLIVGEANGKRSEYSLLMVHAQDHVMNTVLANILIREMIELHKK